MNYDNPFSGNIKPPDMEKMRKNARRYVPAIFVALLLIILAANGIYTLNNGEHAVITRFGSHVETITSPGLQFKIPFVDNRHIVNVEEVRRMEFGANREEALMLTGEESRSNGLVNARWVVQYRISNSYNYLFKVQNPERTLHSVTQAAYRRVTAAHPLDAILTDRKEDMQREIMSELQGICDLYDMGIIIAAVQLQDASAPEEVRAAFLDVTMALEDKTARINEAERYERERLPIARGEAVATVNDAEAYRVQRVNGALGAVARYTAIEEEYRNSPDVMRTRMYLEMIREVLPRVEKVYFLDSTSGNLLEILHLGQ